MPDEERFKQIQMIANVVSSLPPQQNGGPRIPLAPPMVSKWATELYDDFGVRIHPDVATKTLAMGDTDALGNFTPKRVEDVLSLDDMLGVLRNMPGLPQSLISLADAIEASKGDPAKEEALRQHIRNNQPDLVRTVDHIIKRTKPEDLG